MGRLEEIRQKLDEGAQPVDLIKKGYARSSVYAVARSMAKESQSSVPEDGDEIATLRRKKEIVKLQKEIADIEAAKGTPLEKRVQLVEQHFRRLEDRLIDLRVLIGKVGDQILGDVCYHAWGNKDECGECKGWTNDKECEGWVNKLEKELEDSEQ